MFEEDQEVPVTKHDFKILMWFAVLPAFLILACTCLIAVVNSSKVSHIATTKNAEAICVGDWERWHGREGLRETFQLFFNANPDQIVADRYRAVLEDKLPSLPVPACADPKP